MIFNVFIINVSDYLYNILFNSITYFIYKYYKNICSIIQCRIVYYICYCRSSALVFRNNKHFTNLTI